MIDDDFVSECHHHGSAHLMDLIDTGNDFDFFLRFKNLTRFSNIKTFNLYYWWQVMVILDEKYFVQMQTLFQKIKHIGVIEPKWDTFGYDLRTFCTRSEYRKANFSNAQNRYVELASNIIKNNSHNVESIKFERDEFKASILVAKTLIQIIPMVRIIRMIKNQKPMVIYINDNNATTANQSQIPLSQNKLKKNINCVRSFENLQKISFVKIPFQLDNFNRCTLPNVNIIECDMKFAVDYLNKKLMQDVETIQHYQDLLKGLTKMVFIDNYYCDSSIGFGYRKRRSWIPILLHFLLWIVFKNGLNYTKIKLKTVTLYLKKNSATDAQKITGCDLYSVDASYPLSFENLRNLSIVMDGDDTDG